MHTDCKRFTKIILVMDNLNTHKEASLYEAFPPEKARALCERFEMHYTPKHGSWLNMAEIEIGLLARTCLNRRIGSDAEFREEVSAYLKAKNKNSKPIDWQFTNGKARIKLESLCPTIKVYNSSMASNGYIAGISRSGTDGNYTYSVIGSGNRPITFVSWFDAARFTNWLHNGQRTGSQNASTTEDGAYTLNGAISGNAIARNVGATVWLPTENEWFKAVYYDPTHMSGAGGYWLHANQSNSMTSNSIGVPGAANYYDGDYAVTQSLSYSSSQNYLTDVGAYGLDSQSYYGLNDMAGNVWEWNDLDAESGSSRALRGGSWAFPVEHLRSSGRGVYDPSTEDSNLGFRVASIPEPSALVLTILFGTACVTRRKR